MPRESSRVYNPVTKKYYRIRRIPKKKSSTIKGLWSYKPASPPKR